MHDVFCYGLTVSKQKEKLGHSRYCSIDILIKASRPLQHICIITSDAPRSLLSSEYCKSNGDQEDGG
jgi:hypothetical protein